MKTDVMGLEIKQKHQFYSEKFDVTLDILEMSNKEVYYNIDQINSLFTEKFDEYLKTQNCGVIYKPSYFKACQYFDIYGYSTPEDFEIDMILEIDNIQWYSFSYLCPYIGKQDEEFSHKICDFYRLNVLLKSFI
jgi:hypothetical protein